LALEEWSSLVKEDALVISSTALLGSMQIRLEYACCTDGNIGTGGTSIRHQC
jgi:hypothetical protein